jgi:hypothetical protein
VLQYATAVGVLPTPFFDRAYPNARSVCQRRTKDSFA